MKTILKNFLLLTITVAAVISFPFTAHAEENVSTWGDFVLAFESIKASGGVIILTDDIVSPDGTVLDLTAGSPVTIDTGSHSIMVSSGDSSQPSHVTFGSNVSIYGIGDDVDPAPILGISADSTVTVDGAQIETSVASNLPAVRVHGAFEMISGSITAPKIGVDVYGEADFTGGTITTTDTSGVGIRNFGDTVLDGTDISSFYGLGVSSGEADFNSGSITVNNELGSGVAVWSGTVNIAGGTVFATGSDGNGVFLNGSDAVANISGGTITSEDSQGVMLMNNSRCNITGGNISGGLNGVYANDGVVNASGGAITGTNGYSVGIYLAEPSSSHIGGSAQITGGGSNGNGIYVETNSEAEITGGQIRGANGIDSYGTVNVKGGTITGTNGNGIRSEAAAELVINDGNINGTINGILNAGGILTLRGGVIEGINCGITGNGTIDIYSGTTKATDVSGIGLSLTGGDLTVYGGLITGPENGISLGSSVHSAVLYNGSVRATGEVNPYSIYIEGDPPLTRFNIVSLMGNIYHDTENPSNYTELDSFAITAPYPASVDLTEGQSSSINFTVSGQRLNGDAVTLQDQLGATGSLSNATYTVSGNVITFIPTAVGSAMLTINDEITHSGYWMISVNVQEASQTGGSGGSSGGGGRIKDSESNSGTEIILTVGSKLASVNGKPCTLDAEPFIVAEAGSTLVPIRFVGESMGAKISWMPGKPSKVSIKIGEKEIILTIGSKQALVNGSPVTMSCAPIVVDPGRTFVPIRFIAETLGVEVNYDDKTGQISMKDMTH